MKVLPLIDFLYLDFSVTFMYNLIEGTAFFKNRSIIRG